MVCYPFIQLSVQRFNVNTQELDIDFGNPEVRLRALNIDIKMWKGQ